MRAESLDFLRTLCNTPSPSGYEERAAQVYRDYTGQFADEIRTDRHGNVMAVLNPQASQKIMLAGHMDEIGFQVHYIDDKGFLYFRGIGGHDTMVPVGNRVLVHGSEAVPGVIGRKPIHLLENGEKDKRPDLADMVIDIGATSREDAESVVSIGDCVTYQYGFAELRNGRAVARGFDNRVGTFAVAEALRHAKESGSLDPGVGIYAVATVQEEIGLRGARTAAQGLGAQSGIAVDVDFAIDHPGLSQTKYGACDIGKGPSITRGANINPVVFRMLKDAAEKEGIPFQIAAEPGGTGTDANAMQVAGAGMATGLVGIPLRYMHTPCELLDLADAENCARLMAAYCLGVKADTDFTPRIF
ncbi:MAG: M42 family metallopeptidase [Armatimonadetes bacterium]|nr:M42 family metallopeptidase [Armatimonadota bacterium]MBX3108165.1 M42 family metallopeptidase [Fimbriimonadaceae bacterium]